MSEELMGQSCKLKDPAPLPEETVPAMAYIPFQQWGDVYGELKAFDRGTLFPVLDKPFYGRMGEPR